ncbi:hypothetical protein [Actinokineospora globicatena]|uniref:hypothetical protein n=1 Tax=Actinokineospora globicatena TaxID=103729 RepID=UPI0020A47B4D|nr:hypothetical protein [Actinokineospora globicatena]GLW78653.1 hypothetical protein Aglo01_31350 [Actinokineospora globicatena]GLW84679.1 hypothetical protein Aglo02_23190 [Actinokineospora globicatena]
MTEASSRLDGIRGPAEPTKHNARTIAALTSNPGCARRRVLDAAGVDKKALAEHLGAPAPFGDSPFALARGNVFESIVKANGAAELIRLLREMLDLSLPEVAYHALDNVAGRESLDTRHRRSVQLLREAARSAEDSGTLFAHPLLRLDVGGRAVYLEPDLIAFQIAGRFHIVEIKSFPVIDRRAEPEKVAAAAIQSAVYVMAMRDFVASLGHDPEIVSHDVVLVCPRDFSNTPTAALIDVRKQLTTLRRQLDRLENLDSILGVLPPGLTLELRPDSTGARTRPVGELDEALKHLEPRYAPECLSVCEMSLRCREESQGRTEALGRSVQEQLGGIEFASEVLSLAAGTRPPSIHEEEAARMLRAAHRLRSQCLGETA